mmetsp:Transcript_126458/g.281941  ORF Transcript_126458/g.281941 Transcript_126458/m.281941 type:complete len:236 (+) Transcript_126458:1301-2008(+)
MPSSPPSCGLSLFLRSRATLAAMPPMVCFPTARIAMPPSPSFSSYRLFCAFDALIISMSFCSVVPTSTSVARRCAMFTQPSASISTPTFFAPCLKIHEIFFETSVRSSSPGFNDIICSSVFPDLTGFSDSASPTSPSAATALPAPASSVAPAAAASPDTGAPAATVFASLSSASSAAGSAAVSAAASASCAACSPGSPGASSADDSMEQAQAGWVRSLTRGTRRRQEAACFLNPN